MCCPQLMLLDTFILEYLVLVIAAERILEQEECWSNSVAEISIFWWFFFNIYIFKKMLQSSQFLWWDQGGGKVKIVSGLVGPFIAHKIISVRHVMGEAIPWSKWTKFLASIRHWPVMLGKKDVFHDNTRHCKMTDALHKWKNSSSTS